MSRQSEIDVAHAITAIAYNLEQEGYKSISTADLRKLAEKILLGIAENDGARQ